jgi:superfamily II DNA helicase RecQ
MNVRNFNIRLHGEHVLPDQDHLNTFLDSVHVKKTSSHLVPGEINYWSVLVFFEDQGKRGEKNPGSTGNKASDKIYFSPDTRLSTDERNILDGLKQWRNDKALKHNLPGYMICSNAVLTTIAKIKPQSLADLTNIKGLGEQKISKFGDDIIALLNSI